MSSDELVYADTSKAEVTKRNGRREPAKWKKKGFKKEGGGGKVDDEEKRRGEQEKGKRRRENAKNKGKKIQRAKT